MPRIITIVVIATQTTTIAIIAVATGLVQQFNNSMMNKERRRSNRERTFSQIFEGPTGGENLFGEIGDDAVNEFRSGQSFSIDGGDEGYGLDFYGTSPSYKNRAPSYSNGSMPGPTGRKNSLVKPNSYAGSFKSKSGISSAGNSRNGNSKFSKANLGNKSKGSNISSLAMSKNKNLKKLIQQRLVVTEKRIPVLADLIIKRWWLK